MDAELSENSAESGELLFYTSPDGKVRMEIRVEGETIWMSQQMMAELFQTTKQNISLHMANILQCGELQEEGTVKENLTVRAEGKRQVQRKVRFYNLDWIISVGYRVNSVRGTQFRIWATQQLSELMRKGFVLDKDRLKNPPVKGATALPDYFDDLLEQIRDIRASERSVFERCLLFLLIIPQIISKQTLFSARYRTNCITPFMDIRRLSSLCCVQMQLNPIWV